MSTATATQTMVEIVVQTRKSVGARASSRLSPSPLTIRAAYSRARAGPEEAAT